LVGLGFGSDSHDAVFALTWLPGGIISFRKAGENKKAAAVGVIHRGGCHCSQRG
jgi:hypothetical protein